MSEDDVVRGRNYAPMRTADTGSRGQCSKNHAAPVIKYIISSSTFESVRDDCRQFSVDLPDGNSAELYLTKSAFETLRSYAQNERGSERDLLDDDGPKDSLCCAVKKGFNDLMRKLSLTGCDINTVQGENAVYVVRKVGERYPSGRKKKSNN